MKSHKLAIGIAGFLILLLSFNVIFGQTGIAFATPELDTNEKCKDHKYDHVCDLVKPWIYTSFLEVHKNVLIAKGKAIDKQSGIKQISYSIDGKGYHVVSHSDTFSFATKISDGHHIIYFKATDNAHNIKIRFAKVFTS